MTYQNLDDDNDGVVDANVDNQTTTAQELDAAQLIAALDAQGFDVSNVGALDSDSLSTEEADIKRAGPYLNAYAHDGSDPDTRLDNALAAAEGGDAIRLENAVYDADRTISKTLTIIGTQGVNKFEAAEVDATWSLDSSVHFQTVHIGGNGTVNFNSNDSRFIDSRVQGVVNVNADFCTFYSLSGDGSVVFASGTNSSLIDSVIRLSITDNGSNTVGDVA